MSRKIRFAVLAVAFIALTGCDVSVNRSQVLRDGERSAGLTSVNGSIRVGARCTVDGDCRTVNGRVEVGDNSSVGDLDTVNGRIEIGANVKVDGDASTVNGSVESGPGSRVLGKVTTVNGRIELANTVVGEDVVTVNGDVRLRARSVVRGDIVIKGKHGFFSGGHHRLEIRVEDGSIVEGGIDVRDPDSEVKVFIGRDSAVKGDVRNAEVVRE